MIAFFHFQLTVNSAYLASGAATGQYVPAISGHQTDGSEPSLRADGPPATSDAARSVIELPKAFAPIHFPFSTLPSTVNSALGLRLTGRWPRLTLRYSVNELPKAFASIHFPFSILPPTR